MSRLRLFDDGLQLELADEFREVGEFCHLNRCQIMRFGVTVFSPAVGWAGCGQAMRRKHEQSNCYCSWRIKTMFSDSHRKIMGLMACFAVTTAIRGLIESSGLSVELHDQEGLNISRESSNMQADH